MQEAGLGSPATENAMDISVETYVPSGSKESAKLILNNGNIMNHDKACDAKSPCFTDTEEENATSLTSRQISRNRPGDRYKR